MATISRPTTGTTTRRHDVDWIRVLAMASVFLFHNARFFNFDDWHVKNAQLDMGMSIVVDLLSLWIMPMMFVVSGAAAFWALGRGASGFLKARVTRLLVPLVFGIFALAMPQVYMERVSHGQYQGSYLEFVPRFFDGWYGFGGNFAWMGLHLWYLEMLFIFSVLALPVFLFVRAGGQRLLSGMASILEKPGGLLLLAVPAILLEGLLDPEGLGLKDFGGWSLFNYLLLFIYGYLIFAEPRLETAAKRQGPIILGLAFVMTAVGMAVVLTSAPEMRYGAFDYTFWNGYRALGSWCWVLGLLGLGMRTLKSGGPALSYANEAVLPFYMLHQTIIVTLGYFIASWQIPVLPKYLLMVVVSFAIIMVIYELLVRRINLLRFLFGLKPLKRAAALAPRAIRS